MADEVVTVTPKPRNWFRLTIRMIVALGIGTLLAAVWWEYSDRVVNRLLGLFGV